MRGTIGVTDLPRVVFLIRALCPEVGHLGEFRDHDRVYNPAPEVRGVARNSIRLRRQILKAGPNMSAKDTGGDTNNNLDFLLLCHGLPDRRMSPPVERRQLSTVGMGVNAPDMLQLLGCTMQYEYVRSGLRFQARGGFTVEVYVIKKLKQAGNAESTINLQNEDHAIVDIVSTNSSTDHQQLLAFMHCLDPIVVLRYAN